MELSQRQGSYRGCFTPPVIRWCRLISLIPGISEHMGLGFSMLSSAPSPTPSPMEPSSSSQHASTMSSPSDLQLVFNDALKAYEKQTNIYLFAHPLAAKFQSCDSPSATLALLRKQVRGGDDRWTSWLDPTVNVLDALSVVLGERVNLVCFETPTCTKSVSHINSTGYYTGKTNFYRDRCPTFSAYPS